MWALFLGCSILFAGNTLPPIQNTASDEHGRITINGKWFFPILMYDKGQASKIKYQSHEFDCCWNRSPELRMRSFSLNDYIGNRYLIFKG